MEGWTEGWNWTWICGLGSLALCALARKHKQKWSIGTGFKFKLVGSGEVLEVWALGKEKKRMEGGERCTRSLDRPVEVCARRRRGFKVRTESCHWIIGMSGPGS